MKSFSILPSMAADVLSRLEDFVYFESDLPDPLTLLQELELWKDVSYRRQNIPSCMHDCYYPFEPDNHAALLVSSKQSRSSNLLPALRACRKQQFPNVHTILHTMTVWPLTSCEAERSISGLRRLKSYLRSTITGERMNGLALLAVHRCISVSVKETIDAFASKQPRSFPSSWRMKPLMLLMNNKIIV